MKVLIVSTCGLPVPAVKGGAVQTLIESLIIQNEKNNKIDITIMGSYDEEAVKKSKKYKKTNFIFIKEPKICSYIDSYYEKIYTLIKKYSHKALKRYSWKIYVLHRIKKELKSNEYDRIIFENSGYLLKSIASKTLQKKYKGKIYYHLHNDLSDNVDLTILKQCKLVLISKYLEKKIINKCGEEIKNNIHILKNGFDCKRFTQELSEEEKVNMKKKLNINNSSKIIIFTGRITEEKGIKELTTAFERINFKNLKLLVIGSHHFGTSQTSSFEKEMNEKFQNLGDKVKFTGYIPYEEIWKYYKIADLAVLPSIWEEPAGLTMLEATVSGVPLITTNSGGIPEYLSSDKVIILPKDDYLVQNIEKNIIKFIENEEEYKKRAKKSVDFIKENYSEEIFYNNFIKIIKD